MATRRVTRSFVPNLLTTANLFCGFASIVYASMPEPQFERAAFFILLGAIFDMMDGLTARMIKASSEFGGELDSLCDVVTFGIAPSYLLYKVHLFQFNELGIFISALPAIMGALRLARFNVQLSSFEDKKYFNGFPIPSSALTICSYLIFFQLDPNFNETYKNFLIFFVTISTSIVMISTIKYRNIPRPSLKNIKEKPVLNIGFLLAIIAIILSKGYLLFPFMMFYLVVSAIIHIIKWIRKGDTLERSLEEFDYDEYESENEQDYY